MKNFLDFLIEPVILLFELLWRGLQGLWSLRRLFRSRRRQVQNLELALAVVRQMVQHIEKYPTGRSPRLEKRQFELLAGLIDDEAIVQPDGPYILGAYLWLDDPDAVRLLNDLENLLESELSILRGTYARRGAPAPTWLPPQPGRSADAADGARPGAETEQSAALWGITEKFYASSHVRALILVIGLAIAVGTGGAFVLGGQTISMRQDIEKTRTNTLNEIATLNDTTRKRIIEESGSLLTQLHERAQDVNRQIDSASRQVDDLRTGGAKLKAEVVTKFEENLKKEEAALRDQILAPLKKIQDEDLNAIKRSLGGVRGNLDGLAAKVAEDNSALSGLSPQLAQLRSYADQADKITNALSAIRTDEDAARTSVQQAADSAHAAAQQANDAGKAAADAKAQRDSVSKAVQAAADEARAHDRSLAELKVRIGDLQASLDVINRRLAALEKGTGTAESHLSAVRTHLGRIEQDANKPLPPKVTIQPVLPSRTEADLDRDDWRRVQRALTARGYALGKIDGKVGGRTREAIKAFQSATDTKVTGHLTPEQIDTLLKPAATQAHT